ncbi:hypothetical protein L7F22_000730 [Adiantum nelumboides]|nr:hypothetical protein [Adiantum nelumboides]
MGCLVTACLPSSLSALRQEREVSRRLVADRFPQLADLVDDGPLLVVERSPSYWERREDGFQEPQLLFLLGTSHFSTVSALHVHRVVTNVLPQSVVVELCRSRARLMNEFSDGKAATRPSSNLLVMGGKSFGAAMGRSLGMGGQPAMILRFLLALASKKLSSVAGVASGEEFRAAYKAAAEVDAQIVLGDRPIEITVMCLFIMCGS